MLPHLRKLWYGYKERKSQTKRIHLIWLGYTIHLRQAVGPVINSILDEDRSQKSYILYISVYTETDVQREASQHGRYSIYPGKADIQSIVQNEAAGNSGSCMPGRMPVIQGEHAPLASSIRSDLGTSHSLCTSGKASANLGIRGACARTLILVSAEGAMRDSLRRAVRSYLQKTSN
ncbi:hypothetical protein RJ55_08693 [Drechmeria coniospora]|nr:hypothetical protein RJ55_08693 [Drechmeria coniospora]